MSHIKAVKQNARTSSRNFRSCLAQTMSPSDWVSAARPCCGEDLRGHLPQSLRLGRCLRWSAEELSAWVRYGCPPRKTWQTIWQGVRDAHRN